MKNTSLQNLTEKDVETLEIGLSLYAADLGKKGAKAFLSGDLREIGFCAGRLSIVQDLIKRLPIQI